MGYINIKKKCHIHIKKRCLKEGVFPQIDAQLFPAFRSVCIGLVRKLFGQLLGKVAPEHRPA
jgi:hypothetical protein